MAMFDSGFGTNIRELLRGLTQQQQPQQYGLGYGQQPAQMGYQQQQPYGQQQMGYQQPQAQYMPQQAYGNQMGYGFMMPRPSPLESIATALPFLSLPGKQSKYMQPAYETIGAMGDINSAKYQQIYGQQKQQGQQQLAESIAELSRQNRKLTTMGRSPLLDDERGGEAIFRNMTQGYQDVQNRAATDTRSILGNLAQNQMVQGQQQGQIAANRAGIKGNLFGGGVQAALPFLTRLFGL